MVKLTEYDLLLKLHHSKEVSRDGLTEIVGKDARYEKTTRRVIYGRVRKLKEQKLVVERNRTLRMNPDHDKTWDTLAFLYWSNIAGRNYNMLLDDTTVNIFKTVFDGARALREIVKATETSKPTALKGIRTLEENSFLRRARKKPLLLEANVNNHTLYYINLFGLEFTGYDKKYTTPKMPRVHSKKVMRELIRLHTYSTTVTEGNTATEEDVRDIMEDRPVKLTPRETLEIVNTERAVEQLIGMKDRRITEEGIKGLHATLMNNLIDRPGKYYFGRKRIVGSEHKPPGSREEIESSLRAMINFIQKYENRMKPLILAPLAHLLFVSIHPFQDGNGRVARLLHSWILLKKNLPLFAYDPDKKNQYFNLLEEARASDAGEFIRFCNTEHYRIVKKYARG